MSVRTPVRPSPPPISTCLSVIGTEATDDEVNDPGFPNIACKMEDHHFLIFFSIESLLIVATFKVICAYESKAHQRLVQYLYKRYSLLYSYMFSKKQTEKFTSLTY